MFTKIKLEDFSKIINAHFFTKPTVEVSSTVWIKRKTINWEQSIQALKGATNSPVGGRLALSCGKEHGLLSWPERRSHRLMQTSFYLWPMQQKHKTHVRN